MTVFNGYVWTVGQPERKYPFSNKNNFVWAGPDSGSAVYTEKFNKQQEKLIPFNKKTIPHRENVSGILN